MTGNPFNASGAAAFSEVLSRGLPKTGQVTCYMESDDGYFQAGWWQGLFVENNRSRFITEKLYGVNVVTDRATGLMWAADGDGDGCGGGSDYIWADAILYCQNLNFAGFTDWRLPNVFELFSICNAQKRNPCVDTSIFPNTLASAYWTSTTRKYYTIYASVIDFMEIFVSYLNKADEYRIRAVRGGL
ncbi:MAG: hypothetical protein A2167_05470 [Planctomycetes bacterium RBG_13_46_10]|nr:MAG: hypothetical protein A2167_05470 [Planctomycetes bacterium RBG_13_46_10]